ncbi:hypothetical protein Zmor_019449 [Zophobas morio]|uniref:Uncharacterized protein n=1 Tax=Zophobas morio TaxID=2755281 RepID=A0AA38HZM9_9CUCU|nr:hypothetical protein Zmor_019449 [Zophobas morio]
MWSSLSLRIVSVETKSHLRHDASRERRNRRGSRMRGNASNSIPFRRNAKRKMYFRRKNRGKHQSHGSTRQMSSVSHQLDFAHAKASRDFDTPGITVRKSRKHPATSRKMFGTSAEDNEPFKHI